MKKIYLFLIILIIGVGGFYFYQKTPANTFDLQTDFQLAATELFAEFEKDEPAANTKYLDKIIEVSGIVQESGEGPQGSKKITLEGDGMAFGVICQMEPTDETIQHFLAGEKVTLKGICTGKLMDVIMVRCVVVEGTNSVFQ